MKRGTPEWVIPSAEKSAAMRRVRTVGTAPEIALRRRLHGAGLRFRVAFPIPGRPRRTIDIAFTRRRLAVFVDGCFWHGCPQHGATPTTNAAFWRGKLEANKARDRDTDDHLAAIGWSVLRFWEHVPPGDAAEAVGIALVTCATGGFR
jgi:DNA mismatch endonuclease (patch repair protein)